MGCIFGWYATAPYLLPGSGRLSFPAGNQIIVIKVRFLRRRLQQTVPSFLVAVFYVTRIKQMFSAADTELCFLRYSSQTSDATFLVYSFS